MGMLVVNRENKVMEHEKKVCKEPLFTGRGPGIVYLIARDDGLYKIGHSCEFKRRFRGIKYENRGRQLRLVHVMFAECRIEIEAFWHGFFGEKREWREWFRLSDEDVALFRACWGTRVRDLERTIAEFRGTQ